MCVKNILSTKYCHYIQQLSDEQFIWTPVSQLIKQNIFDEWTRSQIRVPNINVHCMPTLNETIPHHQIISRNTVTNVLRSYSQLIGCNQVVNNAPFGIIERFKCIRDSDKSNSFWNKSEFDCAVLALICPNFNDSLYWFQRIQSKHNQWWRNLSKSPLKSKFAQQITEVSKQNSGEEWLQNYVIDSTTHQLESISYLSDSKQLTDLGLNDTHVIICSVDLDNAVSAYLCDAYTEKKRFDGNVSKIMKLNLLLAPFKVAFTFAENTVINAELIELTNYLIECIKEFDVSVYPFFQNQSNSINRFDEFGIPYNIILSNSSTQNGVFSLRNRDTDIAESVHISRYKEIIFSYIKLIHPSNISIIDQIKEQKC